jgi:carotene biosynthesis associated membrane protein
MKLVWTLVALHLAVLFFGLAGMLVALPHPELWAANPLLVPFFTFGMSSGGASQMVLGAAAMAAFGLVTVGSRKTLAFLVASSLISLATELAGTTTGFPFGAYSYTAGLGYKVLGHVPFSVPLSWFYMGFACYLLAGRLASGWRCVALGAVLLAAWDLVLDPAMANAALRLQFWVWHQPGQYYGMPVQNLAGWVLVGLVFMAVSRLAWASDPPLTAKEAWVPFTVYLANVVFGVVLALSAGLWPPVLAACIAGVLPAAWALRAGRRRSAPPPRLREATSAG